MDERDSVLADLLFQLGDTSKSLPRLLRIMEKGAMAPIVDRESMGRELACLIASSVVAAADGPSTEALAYPGDKKAIAGLLTERFAASIPMNKPRLVDRIRLYRKKIGELEEDSGPPGWQLGKAFVANCGHDEFDPFAKLTAAGFFLDFSQRTVQLIGEARDLSPQVLRAKYQATGCGGAVLLIAVSLWFGIA